MRFAATLTAALLVAACSESVVAPTAELRRTTSSANVASTTGFEMVVLPVLSEAFPYGFVMDVDEHGHAVGFASNDAGTNRAVLWSGGTVTDLGAGSGWSLAFGINESHEIVGYYVGADFLQRPFVWKAGSYETLPGTGSSNHGEAFSINESGVIVGYTVSEVSGGRGARWARNLSGAYVLTTLNPPGDEAISQTNKINDAGTSVGISHSSISNFRATIWTSAGAATDVGLGALESINAAGEYVGAASQETGGVIAFRGIGAVRTPLEGGALAHALDINDHGLVVGINNDGNQHPALWIGTQYTDLGGRTPTSYGHARAISNRGVIGGTSDGGPVLWILPPSTPEAIIDALLEDVAGLNIPNRAALTSLLTNARKNLHNPSATVLLRNFITQVEHAVRKGQLSATDGAALIQQARAAIDLL
jgi:uncharacterized membrane protein